MANNKKVRVNTLDVILATHLGTGDDIAVAQYEQFKKDKNKFAIAEMIFYRLYGRYLRPFTFESKTYEVNYKNGFAIMANCCLCIEALQSFKNGWGETPRDEGGNKLFDDFFSKHNGLNEFAKQRFYKYIRCGILHQGETTGGWKIRRMGLLLKSKTINAVRFLSQVKQAIELYIKELKESEWDSEIWDNCRVKMRKVIENSKKDE